MKIFLPFRTEQMLFCETFKSGSHVSSFGSKNEIYIDEGCAGKVLALPSFPLTSLFFPAARPPTPTMAMLAPVRHSSGFQLWWLGTLAPQLHWERRCPAAASLYSVGSSCSRGSLSPLLSANGWVIVNHRPQLSSRLSLVWGACVSASLSSRRA